jgi:hypothetical protein
MSSTSISRRMGVWLSVRATSAAPISGSSGGAIAAHSTRPAKISQTPNPVAALERTQPVLGRVAHIVDGVKARGEQGEGNGRGRCPDRNVVVAQRSGGFSGGDQQRVLDPLLWPHRGHLRMHRAPPRRAEGNCSCPRRFHRAKVCSLSQARV